jgi:hypothetical protein
VNSGKFTGGKNLEDTIVKTNIEAAAEIARQVRLRDIGGIIVCDFIDMSSEAARNKVVAVLEEGLRRDRTRATIQSFSNLGLLEFTRKRVGKDLSAQLRGSCPDCGGLGTVLSSQSVAIETLRKLRAQPLNGKLLLVESSPGVAAQLEFWYEDETRALGEQLGAAIHVRIDPLLHPEKTRIRSVTEVPPDAAVRVGDEREVDLLPGRLPNPASAAAVLGTRIVEVENGANMAGQSARIKVIDVEDDKALAELAVAAPGEKKKRRRRRPGKALTPAEQAEQLRELAEEAAKQSSARPPIGITTITEEEEREDKAIVAEEKAERAPEAILISEGGEVREGGRHRRRGRRRRGRGGHGTANGQSVAPVAGIPPHSAEIQAQIPIQAQPAVPTGDGEHRRRRRRRRRGGRGRGEGGALGTVPPQAQPVPPPPSMPERHIFRVARDGRAEPTGQTAPPQPIRAIAPWNRKLQPPAVEAPPPALHVPEEPAQPTKPARRRRAPKAEPVAALPAAPDEAKPKKTTRARKTTAVKSTARKKKST